MKKLLFSVIGLCITLVSCVDWDNLFSKDDSVPEETDSGEPAVTSDGQLYNMSFDDWSKEGSHYVCYADDASANQKSVWGSANESTAKLGKNTCTPDSVMLAVEGDGKHAVMLKTQQVSALFVKKLAAGSIFTGQMGSVNISKLSATLKWGVPFTYRPKALEGYACYKPVEINVVKPPYEDKKGTLDNGHVMVLLTDWEKQFTVDPGADKFVDVDNDSCIIGYGKITFDTVMEGYEKFTLNIDYRNDRTPRYVVVVGSSSSYGDYFSGGDGSTLWLDEFSFVY